MKLSELISCVESKDYNKIFAETPNVSVNNSCDYITVYVHYAEDVFKIDEVKDYPHRVSHQETVDCYTINTATGSIYIFFYNNWKETAESGTCPQCNSMDLSKTEDAYYCQNCHWVRNIK